MRFVGAWVGNLCSERSHQRRAKRVGTGFRLRLSSRSLGRKPALFAPPISTPIAPVKSTAIGPLFRRPFCFTHEDRSGSVREWFPLNQFFLADALTKAFRFIVYSNTQLETRLEMLCMSTEEIMLDILLCYLHKREGTEREYLGSNKKLRRLDAAMHNRGRI